MQDAKGPDQLFQRALAEGEILLPKCDDCGANHFFPRVLCPHCHGAAISWKQATGKGRVYTTTVVRRSQNRGGDYNVCMVELQEGVRMMSRVEDIAPGEVAIDMAVTAFVGEAEGVPAVLFKPSEV